MNGNQKLTKSFLTSLKRHLFGLQLFHPVEADERDRRRLLKAILLMLLFLGVGVLAIDLHYLPAQSQRWWTAMGILVSIALPLLFLVHRGYVNAVAVALVVTLWIFVTVMAVTGGGVLALVTQAYLMITLIAGLLGGMRYGIFVGLLSVMVELLFVFYADQIPPPMNRTPMSQWFVSTFYMLSMLLLLTYFVRSLRRAFRRTARTLSERQRVEEDLADSEERFRAVYDQTDLGVAMSDLEGRITKANQAFCCMLGLSRQELEGRHFSEFTHPEDVAGEVARVSEIADGLRRSYTTEKRYIRKDGAIVPVNMTVSLLRNSSGRPSAYMAIVEDISERYLAETALRASEERFRITFESAGAGIALVDLQGRLLRANQALADLTGYTTEELVEMNFRDFTHPGDVEAGLRMYEELREGARERYGMEKRYLHKDGSVVWVRLTVSLVRPVDRSKPSYVIAIVEDITQKKRHEMELTAHRAELEERVRERTEELRGALQVAEEATQARTEFLANVSHELRTPMNAVLGLTHLALGTDLDQRQREYLTKIRRAARDLLVLLNDILDFSKMEAGKMELESVPFYLDRLVESAVDLVSVRAQEKGLQVKIDRNPALQRMIGDPIRLRQVLINLIGNAVKFTEKGFVLIEVNSFENDGAWIEFRVTDTGPGIPADLQHRLFDPFRQADGSMTRRFGGTGLGLAICKQLVEQMGGHISLDPSYKEGSRFRFAIPFSSPSDDQGMIDVPDMEGPLHFDEADEETSDKESVGSPLPGRILVVEDNEINLQVARELLQSFGLTVDTARDGAEGVAQASAHEYQVILMDLQMPVMDGFAAAQQIRDKNIQTPILAMTAHAMESEKKRCLQVGMNGHIPKPVDPDYLYRSLARWLPMPARRRSMPDLASVVDVAGFNVQAALQRLDGDVALYMRLLEYFVRDHKGDAQLLRKAYADNDVGDLRRLVHTLRGLGANLSAVEIQTIAMEIEQSMEANGLREGTLDRLLDRLEKAIAFAIESVEKALDSYRGERPRSLAGDGEWLTIPHFYLLLERQSLSARRSVEAVKDEIEMLESGLSEKIVEAMDRLDYEKARTLLSPYVTRTDS